MTPVDLSPGLIAHTQAARDNCQAKREDLARQEADVEARRCRLREAEDEMRRLLEREQEDLVARILDGEESRPQKPKRRSRIENLKQEIDGLKLAIPVLQGRVGQAKSALAEAEELYSNSMLPVVCSTRSSALEDVRDRLASLAPALVTMVAQDIVQRRLVGDTFVFTEPGLELFSGEYVAKTFVDQLGDRLRPPALEFSNLKKLAEAEALEFINSFNGE